MTGSNDPMERLIEQALLSVGEPFLTENFNEARLDFYLPNRDLYIEVKQFHSDRIAKQTARAANVIVAQGRIAVQTLALLIKGKHLDDIPDFYPKRIPDDRRSQ